MSWLASWNMTGVGAATLDLELLNFFAQSDKSFLMEVLLCEGGWAMCEPPRFRCASARKLTRREDTLP